MHKLHSLSVFAGITGSLTGSVTGSLFGTASVANQATTSSFTNTAATASYVSGGVTFPAGLDITGSLVVTGSLITTGSIIATQGFTGSLLGTSSWASNTVSSSFATSASFSITSSYAVVAQNVLGSITSASYAATASYVNLLNQTVSASGDIIAGTNLVSNYSAGDEGGEIQLARPQTNTSISGSVTIDVNGNRVRIFEANSPNRGGYWDITTLASGVGTNLAGGAGTVTSITAGDGLTGGTITGVGTITVDTGSAHFITGSTKVLDLKGVVSSSAQINTGSFTGSFIGTLTGTSSWASNAISSSFATTASYALNAGGSGFPFSGSAVITGSLLISGSGLAVTGSVAVTGGVTASLFGTSSWAQSSSVAISSSFATTASYASTGGSPTFPFTGSAIISGGLNVTGSVGIAQSIFLNGTSEINWVGGTGARMGTSYLLLGYGSGISYTAADGGSNIYNNALSSGLAIGGNQWKFDNWSSGRRTSVLFSTILGAQTTTTGSGTAQLDMVRIGGQLGTGNTFKWDSTESANALAIETVVSASIDSTGRFTGMRLMPSASTALVSKVRILDAGFNGTSSFTIEATGAVSASTITATSVTASLLGTASLATSASFATTASYALSTNPAFPFTGSAIISGSLLVTGSTSVQGAFTATTKSFLIDHQRLTGKKLVYGVVEAPEHSVLVRGRITGTNKIQLPDEWEWLVDLSTVTVQLTAIGTFQQLYVDSIDDLTISVRSAGQWNADIDCFYLVQATRKDVEPLNTVV